ncbi:hypothetical protein GCM10011514_11100 [Emticicia aquatilis]|uniref:Uncharacterized protein n=1 Tax=Emticicia aquatilis TaxID=1537369 RepID=A0A917DLH9_9BACT|nr:hypothetical protein [Emticicia aquatilis]GGD48753.1 hypothetical protein GCM10011514_11100 [Emticicia aquatilis]
MISLDKIAKVNVFKVPNNYFDDLTLSILKQTSESTTSLSSKKQTPFAMPEGYFEGLSAKIMGRIEQIEKKNIDLESLARVNVFKVPAEYFQELEINTNIERFGKDNIFKVPADYFDNLTDEILTKTAPKQPKIIKVNWWESSKIRWSAAASLVLMVGLWFGIPQFTKNKTELALEKVSNEEIKSYLETQDLSYLEYETAAETVQNSAKTADNKALDGLNLDKKDILEHLENQDLEEDI